MVGSAKTSPAFENEVLAARLLRSWHSSDRHRSLGLIAPAQAVHETPMLGSHRSRGPSEPSAKGTKYTGPRMYSQHERNRPTPRRDSACLGCGLHLRDKPAGCTGCNLMA